MTRRSAGGNIARFDPGEHSPRQSTETSPHFTGRSRWSGAGVDTRQRRSARGSRERLGRAWQGAFSTGCPRARSPRQAQRRWAGGGKRGAGSSGNCARSAGRPVPPDVEHRPFQSGAARRRLMNGRRLGEGTIARLDSAGAPVDATTAGDRRKGTSPHSIRANIRTGSQRRHRPIRGAELRFPPFAHRASFCRGPAPWTKRGKRAGLEQGSKRGKAGVFGGWRDQLGAGPGRERFPQAVHGRDPQTSTAAVGRRWETRGRVVGELCSERRSTCPARCGTSPVSIRGGASTVDEWQEVGGGPSPV